jgi:aryl-alcohol dehydrogenase-like predicted oxidoreductase
MPHGTRISNSPQAQARYATERNWAIVESLARLGESSGHSMVQLAVGWLLGRPYVGSVIAGAMTSDQVAANVNAGETELSPEVLAQIDAITS